MPIYFVRLELREGTPVDRQELQKGLASVKCYRFFISKNKSFWRLPAGFYRISEESMSDVGAKINRVLRKLNLLAEYVIISGEEFGTKGLKPITRDQAVLLNKGEEV